jgi:hypothetical protein
MARGNLLVPIQQTIQLSPYHKATETRVILDIQDAHFMQKGKYMLSKTQLDELSVAANVTTVESRKLPTEHHRQYAWQVIVELEIGTGEKVACFGSYELDMRRAVDDKIDGSFIIMARRRKRDAMERAKSQSKAQWGMPKLDAPDEEWEAWIEDGAIKEWEFTLRHATARVETGAYLRAIRRILNIPSVVPETSFKDPWRVYRVSFDIERALADKGPLGESARNMIAASLARSLNLPVESVSGLLKAPVPTTQEVVIDDDFQPAREDQVEEIYTTFTTIGLKSQEARESFVQKLFGVGIKDLNQRQARLIIQSLSYYPLYKKVPASRLEEFKQHIRDCIAVAVIEGGEIGDFIDDEWDEILFGEIQVEFEVE